MTLLPRPRCATSGTRPSGSRSPEPGSGAYGPSFASVTSMLILVLMGTVVLAACGSPSRSTTPRVVPATSVSPPSTVALARAARWASLVYQGPGVVVVGVVPGGKQFGGGRPPLLYLSTDLVHWTDITPPQSQVTDNGGYPYFQQASFLSPSTGWVTSWNAATIDTTIYRTNDGGKTWSTVAGSAHSGAAGAATLIDLVSPTTAFEEDLEPTAPSTYLAVTTDSGQTWKNVYSVPSSNGSYSVPGPSLMPVTFTDPMHGFAAAGVPPVEGLFGAGLFFATSDGGSTWVRQLPPLPEIPRASTCPTRVSSAFSTSCVFALPTFSDSKHGVLAAVVTAGAKAYVAFDVTSDGGRHWTRTSQQSVTAILNSTQATQATELGEPGLSLPLISEPSATSWWLLGWSASRIATRVTTDAGSRWSTDIAPLPAGAGIPISLVALDATHAILNTEQNTANGATTQLLTTTNSGRTWAPLHLPS